MELFPEDTPNTVDNFLNYVESGRYDDTIIHRSDPNFVIQGGGYKSDPLGTEISKDANVINEFNRSNLRGTVAMARIRGQVNSANSEWFVNLADNSSLDNVDEGFTVFGEIISGMSVVDKIGNLPRIDLSNSLGSAFGKMPRTREIGSDGVVADDLVLVNRVYVTDVIVDDNANDGSGSDPGTNPDDGPTATTTYSTAIQQFTLPVRYRGNLYRLILNRDTDADGIVFAVDTTRIIALADTGQDAGTMNLDEGIFTIPSVKVGDAIFTDVTFELTEYSTLTFRLKSYTRP
jgi:peptidyl-prolyl cis-trans isomerase A (cyclophilin A)